MYIQVKICITFCSANQKSIFMVYFLFAHKQSTRVAVAPYKSMREENENAKHSHLYKLKNRMKKIQK